MNGEAGPTMEATAAAYEDRLVPALFAPLARLTANATSLSAGQAVLDVACGTGALTRQVLSRVGPTGKPTGLDANPAMISVARKVSSEIEWHEGQAEDLPFEDATFDAVVCQFGLNFFSDQQAALKEMSRVLAPDGHMVISVFDNLDVNRPYAETASIFERVVGSDIGQALRFPFGLGELSDFSAIIDSSDIGRPALTSEKGTARFPSVRAMVEADVFGWFPFAGFKLDKQALETVIDEATSALEPYVAPSGAVEFAAGIHIASLRKT
ncbi:MAG: methyltransferase domain-containing protein [Rhodospirillales bacterium]|nr:methyltransferase domain-containing protein [Rhodospirillales bacterium]